MRKHTLTLLLCLLAALSFPFAATAADDETEFYALLYADKTLVFQRGDIPAAGRQFREAYPVSLDGYRRTEDVPWRGVNSYVTRVDFADTLSPASTAFWFDGFAYLQAVDNLDKLDFSRATSTAAMFRGCARLTALDMGKPDTSSVTDMAAMFQGCSDLQSLNVSGLKTSNVTRMNEMFYGCKTLGALDVSHFDTSNVTNMTNMFRDCNALKSLDVSKFNTSKVVTMGWMFVWCGALESLDVSRFDTSNVTDMAAMFSDCVGLKSLDIRNFDTSNVTNMWHFFYNCPSLTALDVTRLNTSKVTNMDAMFYGCSSLTALDVTRFDTSSVTNMANLFNRCSSLTALDVSKFDTSNVTNMGAMFYACSSLTSLDVKNFNTSNVTNMGNLFDRCSSLTSLDVSKFDTSNVTNMAAMFGSCSGLTELDVHNFNTSKVTNMASMFAGCPGLTALDLSKFDTSNVTDMNRMFNGCGGLKSLDLRNFNTSGVTDMEYMFVNCEGLESLDVSAFKTGNVTSMQGMFQNCNKLKTLDVRSFNTSNVKNMAVMFYACRSLERLNVRGFDTFNVTNMDSVFRECGKLTALDLGRFDTFRVTNMNRMFYGCSSLTVLDLDNFQTTAVTTMQEMFRKCAALKEVFITGFDTGQVTDMSRMFAECPALERIYGSTHYTLVWNLASDNMFAGCTSLSGSNGTKFDERHTNAEYARIDRTGQAGYFTAPPVVKPFLPSRDAYPFGNSQKDFGYESLGGKGGGAYPIPPESFFLMFGETVRAKLLYKLASSGTWAGNCAGMASSAALLFAYGKLNPSDFGKESVGKLAVGDKAEKFTLLRFIEALQASQYADAFGKTRQANTRTNGQSLEELWQAVRIGAKKGLPTLIAVVKNGVGGHALLAVGVDEDANTVKVYDCNRPDALQSLTLSADLNAWSYDMGGGYGVWGTSAPGCSISYVPYDTLESVWTGRGKAQQQDSQILTVNAANLSITDGKGDTVAALENGQLVTSAEGVYEMVELSMYWPEERSICLPRNAEYTVSTTDDAPLNASMTDQHLTVGIANTTAETVTFNVDGAAQTNSITVGGADASDNFSISMESDIDGFRYQNVNASLDGAGTGAASSVFMNQDGITFTNCVIVSVDIYQINDATPKDGKLSVWFYNPNAATLAVSYFDGDGRFLSADVRTVSANAKAAESVIPSTAATARAMLLDNECRLLCDCVEKKVG